MRTSTGSRLPWRRARERSWPTAAAGRRSALGAWRGRAPLGRAACSEPPWGSRRRSRARLRRQGLRGRSPGGLMAQGSSGEWHGALLPPSSELSTVGWPSLLAGAAARGRRPAPPQPALGRQRAEEGVAQRVRAGRRSGRRALSFRPALTHGMCQSQSVLAPNQTHPGTQSLGHTQGRRACASDGAREDAIPPQRRRLTSGPRRHPRRPSRPAQ